MLDPRREVLGLGWLLQPRWGAVVAFLVALLLSELGFVQTMRGAPLMLGAAVTLATNFIAPALEPRLGMRSLAMTILLFDTALLTGVLFATGGASNPLTALYMIPIAMGSLMLLPTSAWVLSGAAVLAFGLLFFAPGQEHQVHGGTPRQADTFAAVGHGGGAEHAARPHDQHGPALSADHARMTQAPSNTARARGREPRGLAALFDLHLRGMWMAFTLTAILVTYFVTRVAAALRSREQQLARIRARAQRAEKVASLASLAASTAHELGTPFASISLAASEMKHAIARGATGERLLPDVEIVRGQVKRCREILDTMLNEAGETVGEAPIDTSAEALIAEAIQMLPDAERARVELALPGGLAKLSVPPRIVAQSLQNLLRNAIDASPLEAKVAVRVSQSDDVTRFTVIDQGVGMDEAALAEAMEPFVTSKPGRGQGLGLFLTRAVAERLGGELTMTSQPGQGTTATFEILSRALPPSEGAVVAEA